MTIADLPTPSALVDLDRIERNAQSMGERVASLGCRLRPHVKTHKCVEAARLQVGGHFGGITVSTLAEARHFAAAGFDDITYAAVLAPARAREAVELSASIARFQLLLDHPLTLAALERAAGERDQTVRAMLEVDCGDHRTGVDPAAAESLALARAIADAGHVELVGILTHAGHSYGCRGHEQLLAVARQERDVAVAFADRLRRDGIPVAEVSIGSTPTVSVIDELAGVTEVRPGNYLFYDAFQAAIGSCRLEQAAFSVLASVIGHYPEAGRMVIDAGALALSKDQGARHVDPAAGFGVLADLDGQPLEALRLVSLSQEHGVVHGPRAALAALQVGDRLRIIANHSCLAAALHPRFVVTRGRDVVARWEPLRGW